MAQLDWQPVMDHLDLVAATTADDLQALGLGDVVQVAEIDPGISDTQSLVDAGGATLEQSVNCVVVAGRREGVEKVAALLVPASMRADVNGVVRRHLDVRKISFLPMDDAVTRTGMEYGGITPIGLPDGWPVLVPPEVADIPEAVIGSGVRRSKLRIPGVRLVGLGTARVVADLARPVG